MLGDIRFLAMTNDNRGAAALRQLLQETTQAELAIKTDLSQAYISRLASGEQTPKRLAVAEKLRKHAGILNAWWHEPVRSTRKTASQ